MKIYYEPRKIAIKLSRRLLGLLPGLPPETGTLRRAEFGVCCVRYPYCFPLGHTVEGGDEPEVTPAKECELQFGGGRKLRPIAWLMAFLRHSTAAGFILQHYTARTMVPTTNHAFKAIKHRGSVHSITCINKMLPHVLMCMVGSTGGEAPS